MIDTLQGTARYQDQLLRMNRAAMYILYYLNDLDSYILDQLKSAHPKGYKLLSAFLRKFPITERLINDMSLVFKNGFTYSYNGTDKESALLDSIISLSNLLSMMVTVNRLTNLVGDVGVFPRLYQNRIIYDILTPDRCIVKQVLGFPTLILLLMYFVSADIDSTNYRTLNRMIRITALTISTVSIDSFGNITKLTDIEPNLYGYIPVVWFHKDTNIDSFWTLKRNPIITMHNYYSLGKSYLALSLAYQAIATLITIGLPLNTVLPFGPQFWIDLPKMNTGLNLNVDAKYIQPNANFNAMLTYTNDIQSHAAQYANLSAEAYAKSQKYSSGYALLISKTDLLSYNKLQTSMFSRQLSKLISVIIDTINIYSLLYNITNMTVPVVIPEIKVQYTPLLKRAAITWLVQMNIKSIIDVMKTYTLYDGKSDELLIAIYNSNKNINNPVSE